MWASFRLDHLPIGRIEGMLASAPRSDQHAFVTYAGQLEKRLGEGRGPESMCIELGQLDDSRARSIYSGGSQKPFSDALVTSESAGRQQM